MTNSPAASDPRAAADGARAWLWSFGVALACLVFSLVVFSPRLWAFTAPQPGSTYWERGLQFAAQVDQPLGAATEPALVWRLAPVLLAKALSLHGYAAFVVPWIGLVVLLAAAARFALARFDDRRAALYFTALVATTSATLVVTGWLGLNDAWYAAALLAVAYARSPVPLVLALAAGPWIDERFVFALPLALWIRRTEDAALFRRAIVIGAISVAAYAAIRVFNPFGFEQRNVAAYAGSIRHLACLEWLPWTPLGWFMGLRAAWVLIILACLAAPSGTPRLDWPIVLLALAPLAAITFVASDTGRAPTLLLPLLLLGARRVAASFGTDALRRWLLVLVITNVLLPAMHVTHKKSDVINSLPIELARLVRRP